MSNCSPILKSNRLFLFINVFDLILDENETNCLGVYFFGLVWFGLVFLAPSMFGRDLIEQVRDDSKNSESLFFVPVIVTKCIEAVEANGECGIAFFSFLACFYPSFHPFSTSSILFLSLLD